MDRMRAEGEKITFRVTKQQRLYLQTMAEKNKQSLSEYCREMVMGAGQIANARMLIQERDFFDRVSHFITEQEKMMYMIARLTLFIGGEQTTPNEIMKFFNECKADAEKLYGEKE